MSTAAAVMVAVPMVTAEARSEVTLVVPPPTVAEEMRRETRLPASPSGGVHGSPAWSELEGSRGTAARPEVAHPPVGHGALAVEIPLSGQEDTRVEPPAILPSRELVMIQSSHDTTMVGSSSGSGATHELVWPCPGEPRKAWFMLRDEKEAKL